ncbi:MAG: hypothetical protein HYU69_09940 [Bacteroidetes bacterium]|nr:hypothetical protein [Bacteroidota bacterium]
MDLLTSTAFYNCTLNVQPGCGGNNAISTAAGDTIDVINDLVHTDGVLNGMVEVKNNLTINANSDGGTGRIIMNGTGAQTYSVNAAAPRTCHLVIDKSAGALTPAIGTTVLSVQALTISAGDFTAPTGN